MPAMAARYAGAESSTRFFHAQAMPQDQEIPGGGDKGGDPGGVNQRQRNHFHEHAQVIRDGESTETGPY